LLGFLAMLVSYGSTGAMHAGSSSRRRAATSARRRRTGCSMVQAGKVCYRCNAGKNGRAVFDAAPPYK
jgi:hypothetical protein